MPEENYAEYFRYCSPNTILVLTWYNKLTELYCPFNVVAKNKVGNLNKGMLCKVEAVKLSSGGTTVFIINNKPYYYSNFEILIDFV